MPLWAILIVIVVGGTYTVCGLAGMILQQQIRVDAPSKVSYRVVDGPTGLPWVSSLNWDGRWVTLPIHWVRYLRRHPRTWSVTATESKYSWDKPTLIHDEQPTQQDARTRATEVADQIERGLLVLR